VDHPEDLAFASSEKPHRPAPPCVSSSRPQPCGANTKAYERPRFCPPGVNPLLNEFYSFVAKAENKYRAYASDIGYTGNFWPVEKCRRNLIAAVKALFASSDNSSSAQMANAKSDFDIQGEYVRQSIDWIKQKADASYYELLAEREAHICDLLGQLSTQLGACTPYAPCCSCDANGSATPSCTACAGRGWVTKMEATAAAPTAKALGVQSSRSAPR
jgi:hypothetical protein